MKSFGVSAALAAVFSSLVAAQSSLPPIHIKGTKFFYENGTQFYMKGVAYQAEAGSPTSNAKPSGSGSGRYIDPLADTASCRRDVPYLKQLGTNTIRVYAIDPTLDQDECMSLLARAGIYVIADLSQPGESVNRDSPAWDDVLYARYTSVIDKMAGYSNTLGFFAGNEVTNNATNANASPFVKAAVRDMKAYIKEKNYRTIPVGYATNDDPDVRLQLAYYFNCGEASDSIDFWGYNIYSWCGRSSFTKSGFDQRTKEFEKYNIPVFFAEYGCNEVQPRLFTEVGALYGSQMTDVWSGGIVYMYHQEANDYGLVEISGNSVDPLPDFENLKDELSQIRPETVNEDSYTPANTAPQACPPEDDTWNASPNLPPTPNKNLCECMVKSLSCVVDPSVKATSYGDLFGFICGPSGLGSEGCEGIAADGTAGRYGSYSMCSAQEKMSWAMNAYASANGASSCDFEGQARTQTSSSEGSCASQIESAGGPEGTTVSSTSGTGSGSKGAASSVVPSVKAAFVSVGAAVFFAVVGGAGFLVM